MPLPDEQSALFLVLHQIAAQSTKRREIKGIPPKVLAAARAFTEFGMDDVGKLKRSTFVSGQFPKGAVLWMEPPNHQPHTIVALWCKWDFGVQPASCAFNYGEYRASHPLEGSASPDGKDVVSFVGYRFESPHAGDNHNFYHCQPCLNMGDRHDNVKEAFVRPQTNPTWPMPAENVVDLLLCIVVAAYGLSGFSDFEKELLQSREAQKNAVLLASVTRIRGLAR
jgi:hypothetical protein